jgi:hypothetical protein
MDHTLNQNVFCANELCKNIDIILHALPKDIVELIINYVMNQYKFKYTHCVPELFYNIRFNKQLGLIYCNSDKSYRLIDYKTGTYHMSSIINLNIFESQFINRSRDVMKNIIRFEDNVIICCDGYYSIEKYILCNTHYYVMDKQRICDYDESSYVNNQYIYMCDRTRYGAYYIVIYDFHNLQKIKQSAHININEISKIKQILVHENVIYISIKSCNTHVIYQHDVNTLNLIDTVELKSNTITMHQNKIYSYEPKIITVYDLLYSHTSSKHVTTLNKLYTINVNSFQHPSPKYRLAISNDIIMISSEDQIMFYKIE